MPVFIVSDNEWEAKFRKKGIPAVGDDIKPQIVLLTITHRTLANLFEERGVKLDHTYQINTGGNTDFINMLSRERLDSKKNQKQRLFSQYLLIEWILMIYILVQVIMCLGKKIINFVSLEWKENLW